MLTLVSATISLYARKNRIALIEKGIPLELRSEIAWHSTTETPKYNPLEKLPKFKGSGPELIPASIDKLLLARKIQVLADGACDAIRLAFFEAGRGELKSKEWYGRQMRKINGVLKAMYEFVTAKKGEFLVGSELSIADIAAGAFLGMANMVETNFGMIQ